MHWNVDDELGETRNQRSRYLTLIEKNIYNVPTTILVSFVRYPD